MTIKHNRLLLYSLLSGHMMTSWHMFQEWDPLQALESGVKTLIRELKLNFRAAHEVSDMEQVSVGYLILEALCGCIFQLRTVFLKIV